MILVLLRVQFARLGHVLRLSLFFLLRYLVDQLHIVLLVLIAFLVLVHGLLHLKSGHLLGGETIPRRGLVKRWEEVVHHNRGALARLTTLATFV